jgi:uncharacterized protein (DUF433 family)
MGLTIKKEQVPLTLNSDGVMRIGGTRVTLDNVIAAFREGATAEEIVYRYPSLHLADVYAVLSYYLRQQPEVDAYLRQRRKIAEQVHQQNQDRFNPHNIRERLLSRQAKAG